MAFVHTLLTSMTLPCCGSMAKNGWGLGCGGLGGKWWQVGDEEVGVEGTSEMGRGSHLPQVGAGGLHKWPPGQEGGFQL